MSVRQVRVLGDPVLRRRAEPVDQVDDEIRRLVRDMLETMHDADGVGLAAPQVGVALRVIVVDGLDPDQPGFALVNPRIVQASEERFREEEGCLSLPGLREIVERPARVVVEGTDPEAGERRVVAEGLLARVLQHEIDHLDGVLFTDRLSPLKRRLLLKNWRQTDT